MNEARAERLKQLFGDALALVPGEREAWLAAHCGDDPALLAVLRDLLAHHERAGPWFAALQRELDPSRAAELDAHWGHARVLGAYRLERRLGAGGMGVVYLGRRADGRFEREVAIKLLPLGLDTEPARERFAREQRILARLQHPDIAQLLDAGQADDGRPYLVMEYVAGEPLDAWADARALDLRVRVALVARNAEAVLYAHQNLVVHRDLKPSNVLVDSSGQPRLLDFGVSRLLDAGGEQTTLTRAFTPAYAAPEQVRGGAASTASDVYSLGVILYEQLCGARPERGADEAVALPPSERAAQAPPAVAAQRGTRPGTWVRALRGELDLIALKALHADPARRYASAAQFTEDLGRWLRGEPVQARPDALAYRVRKLLARHPVVATAALAALVAVSAFALYQRDQAQVLARERDRAERVAALLVDVFEAADPTRARGRAPSARELLDRGVTRVLGGLEGQPEVAAELALALGRSYQGLGEAEAAQPLLDRAIATLRTSGDRVALARALVHRGENERLRGQPAAAVDLFRESLALVAENDPAHAATRAWIEGKLGRALGLAGQREEARQRIGAALGWTRAHAPDDVDALAERLNDLTSLDFAEGRYAEAESNLREVVSLREAADAAAGGRPSPDTATALNNLGLALQAQGRAADAESPLRDALAIRRSVLDAGHPDLAQTLTNLGLLLQGRGAFEESGSMLREALAIRVAAFGPRHPLIGQARNNLGLLLHAQGEYDEARGLLAGALEELTALNGERHPLVAMAHNNLAALALDAGDLATAAAQYELALALRRELLPAGHPHLAWSLAGLARTRLAQNDAAAALPLAEEAATIRAKLPDTDPLRAEARCALGLARAATGDSAGAAAEVAAAGPVLAQAPPPLGRMAPLCTQPAPL